MDKTAAISKSSKIAAAGLKMAQNSSNSRIKELANTAATGRMSERTKQKGLPAKAMSTLGARGGQLLGGAITGGSGGQVAGKRIGRFAGENPLLFGAILIMGVIGPWLWLLFMAVFVILFVVVIAQQFGLL